MSVQIGIRREDKSVWERRVPIVPEHVRQLREDHSIKVLVQPSEVRVFRDEEFAQAGARVTGDLSSCKVVFAIKEIPAHLFHPGCTYVFFAHVIKGQPYNMPMLKRLLEQGCQLIDYEKVTDERGRRMVFFGRHAGLAGMIDTLWALGQRLSREGIFNPFSDLRQTRHYDSLDEAKAAVSAVGERIAREGLPEPITPVICGFAGYGNVFRGANEIIELLPVREIEPQEVAAVAQNSDYAHNMLYKVVFKEEHMVEPISTDDCFELQDYYDHPEKYRPTFHTYLPHLTMLVNCVYWEARYPRLVTKADIEKLYGRAEPPRLRVIGDVSCDIEGAIECTVKCTEPGDPVFVYDPFEDRAIGGFEGRGPVVLAVDILPSELPRDASEYFSTVLIKYIPAIAQADYSVTFEELALPPEIKRAIIAYQGELTPDYQYIEEYLRRSNK
ncbi:MAG: bifunctional lysine ketoglutarate reductase /saccharopine dehydrogenase family protein [Chloroflexota bacterium]|nr:bifunctional lysine ketoglutarate reductase /saccharopine dehydrogenase family protein [Chloroflexota bacterium]